MTRPLSLMSRGDRGQVTAIHVQADFRRRLVALGLKPGNHVEVIRKGFFSGPLQVRIGTTDIIIRRCDARHIEIAA